eukprot:m.61484 g.61484  ORF g.61484 m.61484 type:complete len:147 (-) comp11418_c0_seq1:2-442(-)
MGARMENVCLHLRRTDRINQYVNNCSEPESVARYVRKKVEEIISHRVRRVYLNTDERSKDYLRRLVSTLQQVFTTTPENADTLSTNHPVLEVHSEHDFQGTMRNAFQEDNFFYFMVVSTAVHNGCFMSVNFHPKQQPIADYCNTLN